MNDLVFSISHWGMFRLYPEYLQSYWDSVWWMNADGRGTSVCR